MLALGLGDLHVLLCDSNGYQVRRMVEVAVDAHGLSTRFRAEHSLVAHTTTACVQLAERIASLRSQPAGGTTGESPASKRPRTEEPPPMLARQLTASEMHGHALWRGALKSGQWRHKQPAGAGEGAASLLAQGGSSAVGYAHPGLLMAQLSEHVRTGDVVCVDTGDITLWASLCLRLTRGSVTLSSERLGTMGYALCAGIAASLERGPAAKAIVIAGDGGFQMTMNELGTAIQHGANLLIIVIDNGTLGRVEFGFKNAKGCQITGCDWVALARSYGADGTHVTSDAQISPALAKGMAHEGIFVIASATDPTVKADMAKTSDAKLPKWLSAPTNKVDSG